MLGESCVSLAAIALQGHSARPLEWQCLLVWGSVSGVASLFQDL